MNIANWRVWAGRLVRLPERTRHRLPPWIVGFGLGVALFFFLVPNWGVDWVFFYQPAGHGALVEGIIPRNPRHILWLLWLLTRLPWPWDYLALMLTSVAAVAAAVHWGGGSYWKAFLSFQFVWILSSGQIDAFTTLGFALAWFCLQKERYWLMGVGILFGGILKPHIGLPAMLCLWLWSRNKWKPLVIPLVLTIVTLFQWGYDWPLRWVTALITVVPKLESEWANASLFNLIGAWAWLAWIPALLVPMSRLERLRAVMAATGLSGPYYPTYQIMNLLVFPTSLLEWLVAQLPLLGGWGFSATAAVPVLVIAVPTARWLIQRWRDRQRFAVNPGV